MNYSRSELVDAAVYNNLKTELYHSFSDEDISVLKHHGILGMKWGVRRYQNEDGSLTPEGERRYYKNEKGEYKKRSHKEMKEYDERKAYERKGAEELANTAKAKNADEFEERAMLRFDTDPEIVKLRKEYDDLENQWMDLVDEIDAAYDDEDYDKAMRLENKSEAMQDRQIKIKDDIRKNFKKFKSSDMDDDEIEGFVDDLFDY
jgi:hypothetical protein